MKCWLVLAGLLVMGCSDSATVAPETAPAAPTCNAFLGVPELSGNTVSVPVTLGGGVELIGLEFAWATFRPVDGGCRATPALVVRPANLQGGVLTWSVDRTEFQPLIDNQFQMEITVWVRCAGAGTVMLATPCASLSF